MKKIITNSNSGKTLILIAILVFLGLTLDVVIVIADLLGYEKFIENIINRIRII